MLVLWFKHWYLTSFYNHTISITYFLRISKIFWPKTILHNHSANMIKIFKGLHTQLSWEDYGSWPNWQSQRIHSPVNNSNRYFNKYLWEINLNFTRNNSKEKLGFTPLSWMRVTCLVTSQYTSKVHSFHEKNCYSYEACGVPTQFHNYIS